MNDDVSQLERKYQVFISSTFKDLVRHRQAASSAIINAGHLPLALENFAPDSKDKATVIQTAIKACQFYVLILGHRYGFVPEGQEKSYVELELDWAEQEGLPILPFLMDEQLVRKKREKLSGLKDTNELNNEQKYWALRQRFIGIETPYYAMFTDSHKIYSELYAFFKGKHQIPGYILEPKDQDASNILKIYAKHEVLQAVIRRFGGFEKVKDRLSSDNAQKDAVAKAFDQLHGADIEEGRFKKVFFESGSTLIYVAKHLAKRLPKKSLPKGYLGHVPKVLTNNALAYVYFWLCEGIMCHPLPEGPPDDKYAGMYGPLDDYEQEPSYDLRPLNELDPDAATVIENLCVEMFGKSENNSDTLILAAMSALQLGDEITAVFEDGTPVDESHNIFKKLQQCRGFHVGSYRNKLFKRCLYLSKAPTIFFIHDLKIDSQIDAHECHFIFDKLTSWDNFVIEHPMSLWIGCTKKSITTIMEKCLSHFKKGNWEFTRYAEATSFPIVIGHNESFRSACKTINVTPHH